MKIANTKHLILDKETEIQKLKKELEISKNVIWKEPFYFVELPEAQDGPYCQKCYDSKKLLIRVQSPNKNGFWICNKCGNNYRDETYKSDTVSTTVPIIGSARMRGY
jgi:ribosomal protein L37AE/L43A